MKKVNPIHSHLNVTVCEDAAEAVAKGFEYHRVFEGRITHPIEIKRAVVVKRGTVSGKPTVDFILEDETGKRFVFMITGALLKSLPLGE